MRVQSVSNYYSKPVKPTFKQSNFVAYAKTTIACCGVAAAALYCVKKEQEKKHNEIKEILVPNFNEADSVELKNAINYYDYLDKTYKSEEEIKIMLKKATHPDSAGGVKITDDEKLEMGKYFSEKDNSIPMPVHFIIPR